MIGLEEFLKCQEGSGAERSSGAERLGGEPETVFVIDAPGLF